MAFTNPYLSFSRLQRFERCALAFQMHYIDGKTAEPGEALLFGKAIHATLEHLLKEAIPAKHHGVLSTRHVVDLFCREWILAGLTGLGLFTEGVRILQHFVAQQGWLDTKNVLGIEQEFRLPVGRFEVFGYIDRVDRIDDETVEVIDYKSNRLLFTREEVDTSLQMSLYELAVREMFPWVKNVRLTFWMLRHGVKMVTSRTPEDLEAAKAYVQTLGEATETATVFPARLSPDCVHCDHRRQCPAYAEALAGARHVPVANPEDLEAVAREREEISRIAKVAYARQKELDGVLKAHLKEREEIIAGGMRYAMFNATKTEYPLADTAGLLAEATGLHREAVLGRIAAVDRDLLDKFMKEHVEKRHLPLLKATLEAKAVKTMMPRLWAKEVA